MKSSTRWALVTFALGITCGVLGHYLPRGDAFFIVLIVSTGFAALGCIAVSED
jgi:hypothetical protein